MLVEFLINKDLIDCEKWFVYEDEVPNFGGEELKDFLNTYTVSYTHLTLPTKRIV